MKRLIFPTSLLAWIFPQMEVDVKNAKRKAGTSTDLQAKGKKNRKDKDAPKSKANKGNLFINFLYDRTVLI